jgi:hypothetical protein
MSATEAIARLRELQNAAGFDLPIADIDAYTERNRTPYIIYDGGDRYAWNVAGKEHRAVIVAAMNSLPALLECAEALETVRGCGVLPISVGRIVDAALQALAEGGGE